MSIKEETEYATQGIVDTLLAFPWEDKKKYANWLAQTYYYVRHSTRLLTAAAARMPFTYSGDKMHTRFGSHVKEERSHEKLALHDIQVLGEEPRNYAELYATKLFYESQYYKIDHVNPYTLLGYILMLEEVGPIVGDKIIARVVAAHGEKAASFLKLHAADDVEHVKEAWAFAEQCDPQIQELIISNFKQSAFAYASMLQLLK